MLFEKFCTITQVYEHTVLIDAKTAKEAEEIFLNFYDGQDLDPEDLPPDSSFFVEPAAAKPVNYPKNLICEGREDDVFILRKSDDDAA